MTEITLNRFDFFGREQEIDLDLITDNEKIYSVILKNFIIQNDFIVRLNSCENLKEIWFINCIFNTGIMLKNIEVLKLENCNIENASIFNKSIKRLYLINSGKIDINDILDLNLITIRFVNETIENLNKIDNFINIEYLYLQDITINEIINYNKLSKLKLLNLDGSKVQDKTEYLKQFENTNIDFSFLDKKLLIN